jgi:hypothetical protein
MDDFDRYSHRPVHLPGYYRAKHLVQSVHAWGEQGDELEAKVSMWLRSEYLDKDRMRKANGKESIPILTHRIQARILSSN